jgi:pantothenate kinase
LSSSAVAATATAAAFDRNPVEMEEEKEICIGSIFGLDVGGTLSKLVYFEKKRNVSTTISRSVTTTGGGKSQSVRMVHSKWDVCSHDSQNSLFHHHDDGSGGGGGGEEDGHVRGHNRTVSEFTHFHESCSEDDLQRTTYPLHLPCSSLQDSLMKRSHSLFDLTSKKAKREKALDRFYEFARRLDTYDTDFKDKNLSFYSRALGGEVHFLQFETRFLPQAMDLIRINDLHLNISKMGATGGGAHKYAEKWEQMLGIEIVRQDELDSLVAGMQFILSDVVGECYTFVPKDTQNKMKKQYCGDNQTLPRQAQPFRSDDGGDHVTVESNDGSSDSNGVEDKKHKENKNLDQYWWSRKVKRDLVATSDSYPYLLVMIGTGVSVLRVDGPRKHERISGSTIGGGTYWGLCRLLTDVEDFESVLNLAEKGDPSKVDM